MTATNNLNLKEEIEKLKKLQHTDSEIYDLESVKSEFPAKIKEVDTRMEAQKTALNEAEVKYKNLQVEKKNKENDLKSSEDLIKKHEGELAKIKTNKEYKTMLEQIESVKANVSLLEEKILQLMDDVEKGQAECEKEKKLFEEEKKKFDKEKEALKSEEKKLDAQLADLKSKREALVGGIDPVLLKRYCKILENRGRAAIAKIEGNCCGECNFTLRAQVINETKIGKTLVFCENCSRILYTED
ncbi:MAG TPA: hypothetical protein PKY78_05705 [Candidatus Omnitrophota bacterium]|nr:hypothetical protein [Candidatus Omnitrophota bacterium]HPS20465.1 hypothetical protein [Candidatus Omnitrophota bacterium]